jgi:hypothetical protein
MRESNRLKRTHLPVDVYEEWVRIQAVRPVGVRRPRKPSENQYEKWMEERVKKRMVKTRQKAT